MTAPKPRLTTFVCVALLGTVVGCGGGSSSAPPPPVLPVHNLRFEVGPDSGLAGRPFGAAIRVRIVDAAGGLVTRATTVQIALADPQGTQLRGTLVQTASNGEAVFDDLVSFGGGRGLELVATAADADIGPARSLPFVRDVSPGKRHVIVMVADGWGYKHIEATQSLTGKPGPYAGFPMYAMSTWDEDVRLVHGDKGYDPVRAWSDIFYLFYASDSASTATAMFSGVKTHSGRVAIGAGVGGQRVQTISELAMANGVGSGMLTSVPINHATPAAWGAHNDSRGNYHPISDEILFGDPKATSTGLGAHGRSPDLMQVVIGCGHPALTGGTFVSDAQLRKARAESGNAGGWTVVDRDAGGGPASMPPPDRLLAAAKDPNTSRLFGLFGGPGANLPFQLHDGSGRDPQEPTLAQMSRSALEVLGRQDKGFYLMIEGGAVDWASHGNNMSQMIGEMRGFNEAVAEVIAWIEDPANDSSWTNTLLIVTGDHECGLLTPGPLVFPDQPFSGVTAERIGKEKFDLRFGVNASWDDTNANDMMDPSETVHWVWHSGGHSNSLVPCYFKGFGGDGFVKLATGLDPKRGKYIDNTDVYQVMLEVLQR